MTDELFFNVMLAASSCMIVTGTILAAVKTPADERAAKYRVAKYVLSVAVLVLGILNMVQIGYDPEGDTRYLGSCLALAVSFVQAMLFTMAVLVMIRPEEVTLRRVLWQAGGIAAVDGVLGGYFSCSRYTCSSMSMSCASCSTWRNWRSTHGGTCGATGSSSSRFRPIMKRRR